VKKFLLHRFTYIRNSFNFKRAYLARFTKNECTLHWSGTYWCSSFTSRIISLKITKNPVVIYSKTTCGYCTKARNLLDNEGISYLSLQIDEIEGGMDLFRSIYSHTNSRYVPQIFICGRYVGGEKCSEFFICTRDVPVFFLMVFRFRFWDFKTGDFDLGFAFGFN